MHRSEKIVKTKYEKLGYKVFRNGAPDFICVKGKKVIFVEVKMNGDRLEESQRKYIEILKKLGLSVRIERPDGIPERKFYFIATKDPNRNALISAWMKKAWEDKKYKKRVGGKIGKTMKRLQKSPSFRRKFLAAIAQRNKNKGWLTSIKAMNHEKSARIANHNRWHVHRNIVNPKCILCQS